MPDDLLLAIGLALVAALTAFGVSTTIGVIVARYGLDELDDGGLPVPAPKARRPRPPQG